MLKFFRNLQNNSNQNHQNNPINEAKIMYHLPESDHVVQYIDCFYDHKNISHTSLLNCICSDQIADKNQINFCIVMEYCEVTFKYKIKNKNIKLYFFSL